LVWPCRHPCCDRHFLPNGFFTTCKASKMVWCKCRLAKVSKHAPIAAEDLARLIVSILENPSAHKGKTYQLLGPKEYTYPEAFAEISDILGHKITYERISLEAFREQWLKRRDPFIAQHLFEVAQDHAAGLFSGTDRVSEKILGHKPMGLYQETSYK
jgi:uncharacterized protein YbjT (DUF2867 family)